MTVLIVFITFACGVIEHIVMSSVIGCWIIHHRSDGKGILLFESHLHLHFKEVSLLRIN